MAEPKCVCGKTVHSGRSDYNAVVAAFECGRKNGPNDISRRDVCRNNPTKTREYAIKVDKCYHVDTFRAIAVDRYNLEVYFEECYKTHVAGHEVEARDICLRTPGAALVWAKYSGERSDEVKGICMRDTHAAYDYACITGQHIDEALEFAITRWHTVLVEYLASTAPSQHDLDRLRPKLIKKPKAALNWARFIDKKPSDDTRKIASRVSGHAVKYAMFVDKGPHEITRNGASKTGTYALEYAAMVDKGVEPVTFTGVINSAGENADAHKKIYIHMKKCLDNINEASKEELILSIFRFLRPNLNFRFERALDIFNGQLEEAMGKGDEDGAA